MIFGLFFFEVKNLYTVEPRYSENLDLVRKIFGPFNKKTFKIDLDIVWTSILCEFFSAPSIALYRGSTVLGIQKKPTSFTFYTTFRTQKLLDTFQHLSIQLFPYRIWHKIALQLCAKNVGLSLLMHTKEKIPYATAFQPFWIRDVYMRFERFV
jgi:hypothetical protein